MTTRSALRRTLKVLVLQPGQLTLLHVHGVRRRFVRPGLLYVASGLLFLAALKFLMDGPRVQVDLLDFNLIIHDQTLDCPRATRVACVGIEHVDGWFGRVWASDGLRLAFVRRQLEILAGVAFLAWPVFAATVAGLYRHRIGRSSQFHTCFVFAAHLHTLGFLAATLALFLPGTSAWMAFLAVPGYALYALHEVFGGRWYDTVARACAIAVIHLSVLLGVAMAATFVSSPW